MRETNKEGQSRCVMALFFTLLAVSLVSAEGVDQHGQAGHIPGCVGAVDNTLGSRYVDDRDGGFQSGGCCFLVLWRQLLRALV